MRLRRLNDSVLEFCYELEDGYTMTMLLKNGFYTQCFPAYKYYKNNSGEWEMCKSNNKIYIPLETLMSDFVMIDSKIDKTITELLDFKRNVQAKNLEDSLTPFCLNKIEEVDNDHDGEKGELGNKITNMDNTDTCIYGNN